MPPRPVLTGSSKQSLHRLDKSVLFAAFAGPALSNTGQGRRKQPLCCLVLPPIYLGAFFKPASQQYRPVVEAARRFSSTKLARRRSLKAHPPWKVTPSGNKLPQPLHAILPWARQVNRRTLIVGDVHGCYDELQELLKACAFQPTKDNLVLVGDIVNKGPKSQEVIDFVLDVGAYVVRGNHDDGALQAALKPSAKPKTAWVKRLSSHQVSFLEGLPFTLQLEGRGVVVVHAGLKPGRDLSSQRLRDLTLLRECRPVGSSQHKVPWASVWQGPAHVFFGHDARRGLQLHAAATGLDTGCCYGNELTACILPAVPANAKPLRQDQENDSEGILDQEAAADATEPLATTEAVFAQARKASKARRTAQNGVKSHNRVPKEAAQQCTALTLAQLQGKLVSVPAKVMYCKPSRPSPSPR